MARLVLVAVLALAWFATPAQAQSVNLLSNASFESSGGWAPYGSSQLDFGMLKTAGAAREGTGFAFAQASNAGASFFQDVSSSVLANRSYSLSLWVRSASGEPIKGTLAAAGILNTATEATGTTFTAGADWTLVTAQLNTRTIHDALRAQVYLDTTGRRLLVDGAQLFDTALNNSSFELGMDGWATGALRAGAAPLPDARDGANVAIATADSPGGTLFQDFSAPLAAGQSYTFSAWLRSQDGRPVKGTVAIWGIGTGGQEAGSTIYTVGGGWTLVTATVSLTRGDHTILRGQIYVDTAGVPLQVDGTQLITNGLANASFDQGFFRWDSTRRGALSVATESNAAVVREGSAYGVVRTDAAGRSFSQDVAAATAAGASRTFSIWLRSPSSASGVVILTGTGGSEESTVTPFNVGTRWTLVSAPLDATSAHSGLRGEVVLNTPGSELDVDAASLSAGNARDDAMLLPVPAPPPPPPPPPAPDADGDGVPDASDLCKTQAGAASRRGCPRGLANDTSISYRRSGTGIRVVRYYVAATKGARVTVSCSKKACKRTVTKGKGAKRVRITRLTHRRLKSQTKITVTVSLPGRLTTTVIDSVKKGRRVPGRKRCYTPGIKAAVTC